MFERHQLNLGAITIVTGHAEWSVEWLRRRLNMRDVPISVEAACTLDTLGETYAGRTDFLYVRGGPEVGARMLVDGQILGRPTGSRASISSPADDIV